MSHRFDEVVIIYNPNSTGDGKKNALTLKQDLVRAGYKNPVTMRQTERAGHAEDIAHEYAASSKKILLVSSSGDGGYHEMVNGIIESSATNITAGLLPSGNANDHYNALMNENDNLVSNITSGSVRHIDILKVTSTSGGKPWIRYAHSYAGIGLSPAVGRQLTKTDLNPLNEKWLVIKYLFKYTHATIKINGDKKRFSSLVFSNIDQMSKVLKLSKSSSVSDGKFEVNSIHYQSKLHVIMSLIKSATFGLDEIKSYDSYTFQTTKKLLLQLDGEVYKLDKDSDVTIECAPHALRTIL